jgi:hypothetical protein
MKPELNVFLSRLLASLVIPGFVACAPYLVVGLVKWPAAHAWLLSGSLAPSAIAVLILFSSGLLMEEVGSWLEWHFWNTRKCFFKFFKFQHCADGEKMNADWYSYLHVTDIPPVMADHIPHVVSPSFAPPKAIARNY